jgi:hypothetical protein
MCYKGIEYGVQLHMEVRAERRQQYEEFKITAVSNVENYLEHNSYLDEDLKNSMLYLFPAIGMTEEQIQLILGKPRRIVNSSSGSDCYYFQYTYPIYYRIYFNPSLRLVYQIEL